MSMTQPDDDAPGPSRSALAGWARSIVEQHDKWDSLHAFETLHWENGQFRVATHVAIDTGFDEDAYPTIMSRAVYEELAADREHPLFACSLTIEAHLSELPATATRDEAARLSADLQARRLHLRDDALECVLSWVADIYGRLWRARKFRDDGTVTELYWPPSARLQSITEAGLVASARAAGILGWGLLPTPAEQRLIDQAANAGTGAGRG